LGGLVFTRPMAHSSLHERARLVATVVWLSLAALSSFGCSDDSPDGGPVDGGATGDAGEDTVDGGGSRDAGESDDAGGPGPVDGGENDAGAIDVSLAPGTSLLRVGARQTFTATVSGTTDLSWDASCGSIEVDGHDAVFTAPWEVVTECTITATSLVDPSISATAAIETTVLSPHQLLPNPAFGEDVDGWVTYSSGGVPRAVFHAEDAAADGLSGSAEIRHLGVGNNGVLAALISDCLPSTGGYAYHLGATTRILEPAPDVGLRVIIQPYQGTECTSENRNGLAESFANDASTAWTTTYQPYTAPADTTRILVSIGIFKPAAVTDDFRALVDNVFLFPQDPPPAQMEGDWVGRWGTGLEAPDRDWTLVMRPNGIYDVDTPGTDGAGVYWVSTGMVTGVHTYDTGGSFAIAASVDAAFTRIEGTWGAPPAGTDGGSFFVDKE
jgi:hypothetical protein